MGLLKTFVKIFSRSGDSNESSKKSYKWESKRGEGKSSSKKSTDKKNKLPKIRRGKVAHIGDGWAIIEGRGSAKDGFLPIRETSDQYVESIENEIQEGQDVKFVPIEKQSGKDRDKVSLSAVDEVRRRKAIREVERGDEVEVEVLSVEEKYVKVFAYSEQFSERNEGVPGKIHAGDLDYGFVRFGELHHHLEHGDKLSAVVTRKVLPDGWKENPKARHASLRLSRERALPERDAETIEMRFGATPFHIETAVRLPRRFDPIARFVFEALHEGYSRQSILEASSLPENSLEDIAELLRDLDLVGQDDNPTTRGEQMYQAMQWSDDFNEANLEGLFSSTAPLKKAFMPMEMKDDSDLPAGWPSPMWCPQTRKEFIRAGGEDLNGLPFDSIFPPEEMERIQKAIDNPRLWVYLRPSPDHKKYVRVRRSVSDEWLLNTLWMHLKSAEQDRPFQPDREEVGDYARRVRLVQLRLRRRVEDAAANQNGSSSSGKQFPSPLWWEPASDTFWQRPKNRRMNVKHWHDVGGSAFPDLPEEWWTRIRDFPEGSKPKIVNKEWKSMVSYYGHRT